YRIDRESARRGGVAASRLRRAADRLRAVRVAGPRESAPPPARVVGVPADLCRRRGAADRAHPYAVGAVCRTCRLVALAGTAARAARQPHRRVGLAGVPAAGRAAAVELPRGLGGEFADLLSRA